MLAGASIGLSGQAMAVGTSADTAIVNTATISYKVGDDPVTGTSQVARFNVDNRIDMTLLPQSGTGTTTAMSPDSGNLLIVSFQYLLKNSGNSDQHFKISAANTAVGTVSGAYTDGDKTAASNVDLTPTYKVYAPVSAVDSSISTTELTNNTIQAPASALAGDVDASAVYFWVSVEIPASGYVDLDTAVLEVIATAATDATGSTSPNHKGTDKNDTSTELENSYNVFADGADADALDASKFNGIVSSYYAIQFEVGTLEDPNGYDPSNPLYTGPKLTALIINDPLCDSGQTTGTTGTSACKTFPTSPSGYSPKAIPGALVEFTFTVTNNGTGPILDLAIEELLTTQFNKDTITYVAASGLNDGSPIADPVVSESVGGNGTDTINVNFGDLAATKSAIVKYRAILN